MNDDDFEGLMRSIAEAKAFLDVKNMSGMRIHIPKEIDSAAIRKRVGLSQSEFAETIGVSVGTLRNWEQGRRMPDGPARVLLALLARDPQIVARTLKKAA